MILWDSQEPQWCLYLLMCSVYIASSILYIIWKLCDASMQICKLNEFSKYISGILSCYFLIKCQRCANCWLWEMRNWLIYLYCHFVYAHSLKSPGDLVFDRPCVYISVLLQFILLLKMLNHVLYYSHITKPDGRPTVFEQNFGKSGDVGRLSADVGTDFGWIFGRPITFLSKHPS